MVSGRGGTTGYLMRYYLFHMFTWCSKRVTNGTGTTTGLLVLQRRYGTTVLVV